MYLQFRWSVGDTYFRTEQWLESRVEIWEPLQCFNKWSIGWQNYACFCLHSHPQVLPSCPDLYILQMSSYTESRLGSLQVEIASLWFSTVVFTYSLHRCITILSSHLLVKKQKTEMIITHVQRIGFGLVLSVIATGVATLVKIKRKRTTSNSGLDATGPLPMSFFWIAFQYLFLGWAESPNLLDWWSFSFEKLQVACSLLLLH